MSATAQKKEKSNTNNSKRKTPSISNTPNNDGNDNEDNTNKDKNENNNENDNDEKGSSSSTSSPVAKKLKSEKVTTNNNNNSNATTTKDKNDKTKSKDSKEMKAPAPKSKKSKDDTKASISAKDKKDKLLSDCMPVLNGIARNEISLVNPDNELAWFVPKTVQLPQSTEQWEEFKINHSKLKKEATPNDGKDAKDETSTSSDSTSPSYLVRVDRQDINELVQPPLYIAGIQYLKFMSHGCLLETDKFHDCIKKTSGLTNTSGALIGTRAWTKAHLDQLKKKGDKMVSTSSAGLFTLEAFVELRDQNNRKFATLLPTLSQLFLENRVRPDLKTGRIEIVSPKGFVIMSKNDRSFVIPKDFLEEGKENEDSTTTSSSSSTSSSKDNKSTFEPNKISKEAPVISSETTPAMVDKLGAEETENTNEKEKEVETTDKNNENDTNTNTNKE
jgi:hypothetical protein